MSHINYSYNFIFVRTPRTASRSILNVLNKYQTEPISIKGYGFDFNHIPCKAIHEHYPDVYNSFFKFAIVRNPWCRMVSMWTMDHRYYKQVPSFNDYVKSLFDLNWLPSQGAHKQSPRNVWLNKNCNMYDFTKGVDFIGKFENIQNDFKEICKHVNLPATHLPQFTQKDSRPHYSSYYDNETRAFVAEKYAKDIKYFGYKFGD